MSFFRKQIRVGFQYLHDWYQLLLRKYVCENLCFLHYVCMYVYAYVLMYVLAYVCMYVCIFTSPEIGVAASDSAVVYKAFSRNFGPGLLLCK